MPKNPVGGFHSGAGTRQSGVLEGNTESPGEGGSQMLDCGTSNAEPWGQLIGIRLRDTVAIAAPPQRSFDQSWPGQAREQDRLAPP